jgi:hypothetical protein
MLLDFKNFINHEYLASTDYYTVYHATSRISYFYMQLETILRHMVLKKNIHTTIFRQPNNNWVYGDKVVKDMKTFKEFALDKLQQNKGEAIQDGYFYEQDGVTNMKNIPPVFDYFSWYKMFGISVNLTLASGQPSENSINYLVNNITYTDSSFIITRTKALLNLIFDNDQAFNDIMEFYNGCYNSTNENCSTSVLLQIHIKKEIIDEILYISTPHGLPITNNAGKILDMYQSGDYTKLKNHLHTISREHLGVCNNNMRSPNQPFTFDNYLACGSAYMMGLSNVPDSLLNVQGRFVCANEELIVTPGNVIVSSLDKNSFNDNYKFYELYKLLISLLIKSNKIDTVVNNLENMDI